MGEKHNKVCIALNYFEHFPISVSAISGCVLISVFASLSAIPVAIASWEVGLKICALNAKKWKL